ncbi:carbohydrate ABC transporter permease [Nonomuraea sp. PA05]|uniref:carbohydrate ABC transporter permease n=1 Tax=Nonomuraea sp. PA05 TaxID=2604466 RepID=UPI0011D34894|nr:carbohydrate ABC transporter permease [Nonomuraea sp. PA05]TYB71322.1 carbohydrate ABC transporter permease [Nonomuraea sp. PA05]
MTAATRTRAGRALLLVLTLAAIAFMVLPTLIVLLTAFKPQASIDRWPPTLLPGAPTLDNFATILDTLPFGRMFLNSLVFATGVTALTLVFDSLAAYALARIDFRGRRALLLVLIATLMVPFQATLIPVYQIVADLGWVNTFQGMITPRAASVFGIYLLRQFFVALPRDLDSAARLDGAGEFRVFWSIVLPNATPALITLGLFSFVNNWNDLLWPLIFTTTPEMATAVSGLSLLTGQSGTAPYGVMMAGALITTAPLVIIFLFFQRRFVEGVATTGMK